MIPEELPAPTTRGIGGAFIDLLFRSATKRPKFFLFLDKVTMCAGASAVPLSLAFLTAFFWFGSLPQLLIPTITDIYETLLLLFGLAFSLLMHESSHIISLANRGIKAKSMGISLSGVVGGYVQADIPKSEFGAIKLPFYSAGIGVNLLLFLFFLALTLTFIPQLKGTMVGAFWFLILNSIPAPLMDGGKVFDSILKKLQLERHETLIPTLILLSWFIIFVYKSIFT